MTTTANRLKFSLGAVFFLILMMSCAKDKKHQYEKEVETETFAKPNFPEELSKVFNAHGGLKDWQKMKSLRFGMSKNDGIEITTTDLQSRSELIDNPNFTIGYDGEILWVKNKSQDPYKGNARFYKGLMFYFYAMPFVLGDDGIIYSETEPLEFEEMTYPGIKISYNSGVGESPEDEYILYYNKNTYQMEWLAYTVTFGKDEKSKDFHFIRYDDWQNINGLKLPESISWYTYENNTPKAFRNTVQFIDVSLSERHPNSDMFKKPQGALIVD